MNGEAGLEENEVPEIAQDFETQQVAIKCLRASYVADEGDWIDETH
jgi:hypothetical protein